MAGTTITIAETGTTITLTDASPSATSIRNVAISAVAPTAGQGLIASSATAAAWGDIVATTVAASSVIPGVFTVSTDWSFAGSTFVSLGAVATIDINGGTIGGVTLDGTISGTPTWASTQSLNTSGLAATATALATARAINGVDFDGTAPITVTAAAGTLTGTALKATVVTSSLTSVGTLGDLTVTNPITGDITGDAGGNAATATLAATVTVIDSVNATSSIAMFDSATGSLAIKTDAGLTYDATAGKLAATIFDGPIGTGAATPAAGAFTTGAFSGAVTVTGADINVLGANRNLLIGDTTGALDYGLIGWDTSGNFMRFGVQGSTTNLKLEAGNVATFAGTLAVTSTVAWGTGATIASSNDVRPDYAAIGFDGNAGAHTVSLVDAYFPVTEFDTNGLDEVSTSDQANNAVTAGDNRDYLVHFNGDAEAAGSSQDFAFDAMNISQTTVAIQSISNATPAVVVTQAVHNLTTNDLVKIKGCTTMTEPNGRVFRVTVTNTTTFELEDDEGVDIASGAWGVHDATTGTIQEATKTGSHAHRTFSNAQGFGSFSGHWPYTMVSGDSVEVFMKNKSSGGNVILEGVDLMLTAL